MSFAYYLQKLIEKEDLQFHEARLLMEKTISGELSDIQIAAWIVAYQTKGESSTEILSFANVLHERCIPLVYKNKDLSNILIDTCGTGGDNSNTINISTLSGIVLSSMGYKVAKHGNRSISSQCGSSDILEKLGYQISKEIKILERQLSEKNFTFLYAPYFHTAMKNVANVRKTLKIKTIFNLLGPLINPANPNIQLMGVSSISHLDTISKVFLELPREIAMVVFSHDGLDEISPSAKTTYCIIQDNQIEKGEIDPKVLPINQNISLEKIQVADPKEAFKVAEDILKGSHISGVETISLNVCACMYLVLRIKNKAIGMHNFLLENIKMVKEHIYSGKVWKYFQSLV